MPGKILLAASHTSVPISSWPSLAVLRARREWSHLHEHLVDLDIPGDSRRAEDWARFFWRAHNFVNEQTQVTRCGSQECGWGSWTTPAAAHEPVGVYRNPWFMTYANAEKRWKHADE